MIAEEIKNLIKKALKNLGIKAEDILLEHPADLKMGDYSTNVALALAKKEKKNPKELAEKIVEEFNKNLPKEIAKIETAGAGFINFYLSPDFFADSIKEILKSKEKFGQNDNFKGQKFFIEHTQPNPFKEFHIGHLMNNTIGESIVRLAKESGGEVKTATYHGDKGLHVAKAIWAMMSKNISVKSFGEAYAYGHTMYEENEDAKKEIIAINKKIYDESDPKINEIYEKGKKESLDYFESIYKRLDNHFDFHFYESAAGEIGKKIVLENIGKVFEESEGAVVFKGEKFGLHTRVFLNSEKLPTYEAKEVGLAQIKKNLFKYDKSITITADEQDAFFNVAEVAIGEVFPDVKGKLMHISHGLLKLPSGKMSSRTGTIISADSLLRQIKDKVLEKISEREFTDKEKDEVSEMVAIGALKYSILKQAIGGDIIFDFEKSISFEGDSGPYLQYSYARAKSILEKASPLAPLQENLREGKNAGEEVYEVEKLLYRFPEIVLRASEEYEPHYIANYLIDLARAFNAFYGNTKIIDKDDPSSPYKVALTEAFSIIIKNGLYLLGIKAPERM